MLFIVVKFVASQLYDVADVQFTVQYIGAGPQSACDTGRGGELSERGPNFWNVPNSFKTVSNTFFQVGKKFGGLLPSNFLRACIGVAESRQWTRAVGYPLC